MSGPGSSTLTQMHEVQVHTHTVQSELITQVRKALASSAALRTHTGVGKIEAKGAEAENCFVKLM